MAVNTCLCGFLQFPEQNATAGSRYLCVCASYTDISADVRLLSNLLFCVCVAPHAPSLCAEHDFIPL